MRPILHAVQTAYSFEDEDDDTWLERVLLSMRGVLESDRGICALAYEIGTGGPRIHSPRVVEVSGARRQGIVPLFESAIAEIDRDVITSVFSAPRRPLQSTSEMLGNSDLLSIVDAADFVGGRIQKSDTEGYIVGSLLAAPVRLSRATRAEVTRLFAHIEAALRLRGARRPVATIARGKATNVSDDAVRAALPKLHEAHPGMLASRAGARDLGAWSTRVDARYSLVATKVQGEANVLVNPVSTPSLPNEPPRVRAVAKLLGEGHPQKLIAYELGIPEGSVYRHVARLKVVLGEPTTVGLVARLVALEAHATTDPGARATEREAALAPLSPAERFVVEGALRGLAAGEIASVRGISVRTAENLLLGAYRKLGVGSRKELAAKLGVPA